MDKNGILLTEAFGYKRWTLKINQCRQPDAKRRLLQALPDL